MAQFSFKKQGDTCLKNARWEEAVKAYTSALAQPGDEAILDAIVLGNRRYDEKNLTTACFQQIKAEFHIYSRCYASLGDLENAVVDARLAIRIDSTSVKVRSLLIIWHAP